MAIQSQAVLMLLAGSNGEASSKVAMIDYEREYSPSTIVPDYLDILGRWVREAADYRSRALAAGRAKPDLAYGDTQRQRLDLFLPPDEDAGALALFIHGGWWQMLDRLSFSHMARGLNAHGIAVAVTSYDLTPQVSVAEIVAQMRRACVMLWRRHGRRLVVFGHSAGGHLTAAMAATDWRSHGAPADLIAAGYAISGAFDLEPLLGTSMNRDWKLDAAGARALSPLHWPLQDDVMFDAVVGERESDEFRRQSRVLSQTWNARYEEIAGKNHFTILDALADPETAMVRRLTELAMRTRA
jgi:arylformamidase